MYDSKQYLLGGRKKKQTIDYEKELAVAVEVCKFNNIPFTSFSSGEIKIPTYFFLRENYFEYAQRQKNRGH